MTQFLGTNDYEILDTWVESHRTVAGESRFRMYKVSTGQYLAINEQDGALYDSEGLAALTNATIAALSPLDKISPTLREMAEPWGETRLVTIQLAMPVETMQLVRSAFDTAGTEEQAPLPYEDAGIASATDEEDMAAQLNQRLAALSIQETSYAGVIDSFLLRNNVPAQDAPGEKIVYRYRYAPAVALNATWEECLAFAADPNVVAIHHEVQFADANERSAAAKTVSAWASGYNGTGNWSGDRPRGRHADEHRESVSVGYHTPRDLSGR
jgi:hypothetical protein